MAFDTRRTILTLAVIYGLLVLAFIWSPMPMHAVKVVLLVLAAFGALIFYVGFRYGQYRSGSPGSHRSTANPASE